MVEHFEYLVDTDDNCFIALGDARHDDGGIPALPVYAPDPDGDRCYDGTRLSKAPKDGSADLAGEPYDGSGVRFGALSLDPDRLRDGVDPYRDREQVADNMGEQARAVYDAVRSIEEDVFAIGSDVLDVGTGGSDLDLVWPGDYDDFVERKEELMAAAGLEEVTDDWLDDRIQDHAERYGVPEAVADYHHRRPQQRFRTEDGLKVGFSPSHVPGTAEDRWLPGPEADGEPLEGVLELLDDDGMDGWPRTARVRHPDHGDLELVTYHWAYGGSFEDGDRLAVDAELFPEQDAVFIREEGQYAVPEQVLEDR